MRHVDDLPCGLLTVGDDNQVLDVNRPLLDLLGHERMPGPEACCLLCKSSRIYYQTHLLPLLHLRGKLEEVYLSMLHRDGKTVPVMLNATRKQRDGVWSTDYAVTPMAHRDRFEEQLIEARRQAEQATRAKDEFLALVSHELRAPLNAILGWAYMLKSGELDDEERQTALDVIETSARTQAKLVQDLLDSSAIMAGEFKVVLQRTQLADFIQAAAEIVRPSAGNKGIRVHVRIVDDAQEIQADAERMRQVMCNLLVNAVKFTPEGGEIFVEVERRESHLLISIEDTGCGIEPEFLPYVFERFRQSEKTRSQTQGGIGLGLAITLSIVELHGGTIRVSSQGKDKGTRFEIALPTEAPRATSS